MKIPFHNYALKIKVGADAARWRVAFVTQFATILGNQQLSAKK
jgi:hypothetical protein